MLTLRKDGYEAMRGIPKAVQPDQRVVVLTFRIACEVVLDAILHYIVVQTLDPAVCGELGTQAVPGEHSESGGKLRAHLHYIIII
jgi:hypothetical protein